MLFLGERNNHYTIAAFLSGLQTGVQKNYRIVKRTPLNCFNNFVQTAVNARREGDENLNCSVVAETMKLLANSPFGYQSMDCGQNTVKKYLNDEKTHENIKNELCKRLFQINDQMYEVEIVKSEIEHKGPINNGFFIPEYAKVRSVELCFNFFEESCDLTMFEELEMDTISLYLALPKHDLYDCIGSAMEKCGTLCKVETVRLKFQPHQQHFFPPYLLR